MKHSLARLLLLAILCTTTLSVPVRDSAFHHLPSRHGHLSLHRGLSHRVRAALVKRSLNLTFTPADPADNFVHVEYSAFQTSDSRFSATLVKLGHDPNGAVDAERLSGGDTQIAIHPPDTYGGRHVIISTSDSLVRGLQQRGVSQDDIPQYVRQNVRVTDPNTGDQYHLVPGNDPEGPVPADPNAIMIALRLN